MIKKLILPIIIICLNIGITISFTSCKNEDFDFIIGTWFGTVAYNNPVSGIKYQYLSIEFKENGLGSLEYDSPVSYSVAKFTYTVKNNVITCNGASANTGGDTDGNFTMKLRIEGERLIPIDKYNDFILTKDNSVLTDLNGKEVIDNSELLYGVWLHSSDEVVLVLGQSYFTEYTLLSPSSNIYSKKTEGSFSYNILNKYVLINGSKYDIVTLSEKVLQLKSESGIRFNYVRGDKSDIPNNGENSTDYKSILENASWGWISKNSEISIKFFDSNKVSYVERSSKTLGAWGYISLDARGTYSISGKTIECNFTDVEWQGGGSDAKNYFPGWVYKQPCNKEFTIMSLNVETMTLMREGKMYIFYNK